MADDEKVLTYHDIVLRKSDLDLLKGPCYLNDRIIEFYFSHISSFYQSKDILLVSPTISFWLANCQDYESLEDFVRPLCLQDKQLIIFVVNNNDDVSKTDGGTHWSLLVYFRKSNSFVHHDSLGGLNSDDAMKLYDAVEGFVGSGKKKKTKKKKKKKNLLTDIFAVADSNPSFEVYDGAMKLYDDVGSGKKKKKKKKKNLMTDKFAVANSNPSFEVYDGALKLYDNAMKLYDDDVKGFVGIGKKKKKKNLMTDRFSVANYNPSFEVYDNAMKLYDDDDVKGFVGSGKKKKNLVTDIFAVANSNPSFEVYDNAMKLYDDDDVKGFVGSGKKKKKKKNLVTDIFAVANSNPSFEVYDDAMKLYDDDVKGFVGSGKKKKKKNLITDIFAVADSSPSFEEGSTPQQTNFYDCGLYVLAITRVICQWYLGQSRHDDIDLWFSAVEEHVDVSVQLTLRIELLNLIEELR